MSPREIVAYEGEPFEISPDDLAFLRRHVAPNLEVHADGAVVRRLAGHASLPSGTILRVRSRKTSARSLLAWLAYCDPTLAALRTFQFAPNLGQHGELAALTASLYASELLRAATRHGLARAYVRRTVEANAIRGRIDFAREARAHGATSAVACVVWERSPETIVNRWLATGLHTVMCDALMRTACRAYIPQLKSLLGGIAPLTRNECRAELPRLPRHLVHLESALALASLIVRASHLDEGHTDRGVSFFINLEWLFEATVVRAIQQAGITVRPKHSVRFHEISDAGDVARSMQLDLYCPSLHGGLVVDAKYKTRVTAANLQQMVTYCFMTGATRAALIFPAGHISKRERFCLSAPTGAEINIDTFELRTDAQTTDDWKEFGARLVRQMLDFYGSNELNVA